MPSLFKRDDSAQWYHRSKVPADIAANLKGRLVELAFPAFHPAPAYVAKATVGSHVKVSLRTSDPGIAKARNALFTAHLEQLYAGVRRGPVRLTQRDITALSSSLSD